MRYDWRLKFVFIYSHTRTSYVRYNEESNNKKLKKKQAQRFQVKSKIRIIQNRDKRNTFFTQNDLDMYLFKTVSVFICGFRRHKDNEK